MSAKLPVVQPAEWIGEWEAKPGVPPSRAHCRYGARPCPYLACRHHLWVDSGVDRPGRRYLFSEGVSSTVVIGGQWSESCSLDLAEREHTAAEIGRFCNITKRRVQQILKRALAKLREAGARVEELKP